MFDKDTAFILPTILSHKWQLFETSARMFARLNLASVAFTSFHFVIGHLEKSFPENIM